MVEELITIFAEIELLQTENSRKTPIHSGYRPIFKFINASTMVSAKIDLINSDSLSPGKSGIVKISFIKGMLNDNIFKPGEAFIFHEGQSLIGKGKIIEKLNEK